MNADLPVVRIRAEPLPGVPTRSIPVPVGRTIAECVPVDILAPVLVAVDGHFLPRRCWDHELQPGQVLDVHVIAHGGDGSSPLRVILLVALIVVANVYGASVAGALGITGAGAAGIGSAIITFAGSLAINAIAPVEAAGGAGNVAGASPTYSVALQGNSARLGQAIPVPYGYNRMFLDFAAQPYSEFQTSADGDDDSYYCALFCIGHGRFEFIRAEIDDTNLDAFTDVEYNVLPPGVKPSLVLANVVTAPEISGQVITSGRYVGPFSACGPKQQAKRIDIDVVFNGLARAEDDGDLESVTVDLRFEARPINDFGSPIGPWFVLGNQSIRGSTMTAVRRTFRYTIGTPQRLQVRAVRVDIFEDNARVQNTPLFAGMRCVLQQEATLQETATHFEVRMRASDQLNGLSQRRIAVTVIRRLRTWNKVTGFSGAPVATRNPAWALLDKWTDTTYGDGLPLSRLNLGRLADLAELWDQRQDRFDMVFDQRGTSIEADQTIAGVGRAAVIERLGRLQVIRDQPKTLPQFVFGSRSIRPDSLEIAYSFPEPDITPDGVVVEYFDVYANDWLTVDCPCPGIVTMQRPQTLRLPGIRGRKHAEREGLTLAAIALYRRKSFTWRTELLGSLPAYGSLVGIAPALEGWAKSGDVVDFDADARRVQLSEPVTFTEGDHFLCVQMTDGTISEPLRCGPGPDAWAVDLEDELPFDFPSFDDTDRERPKFVFGSSQALERLVSLRSITPAGVDDEGTPIIELAGVNDDPRVHTVDNHLLPVGNEVQDSITDTGGSQNPNDPGDPGGGGSLVVIDMPGTYNVTRSHVYTNELPRFTLVGLRFNVDGTVQQLFGINTNGTQPGVEQTVTSPDEKQNRWDRFAPHEPGVGAQYAIRFRVSRYYPAEDGDMVEGSAFNTWLPLSTARELRLYFDEGNPGNYPFVRTSNERYRRGRVSVDIREVATGTIQDSAIAELFNELQDFIPGGE